jgi:hypothetical protein
MILGGHLLGGLGQGFGVEIVFGIVAMGIRDWGTALG